MNLGLAFSKPFPSFGWPSIIHSPNVEKMSCGLILVRCWVMRDGAHLPWPHVSWPLSPFQQDHLASFAVWSMVCCFNFRTAVVTMKVYPITVPLQFVVIFVLHLVQQLRSSSCRAPPRPWSRSLNSCRGRRLQISPLADTQKNRAGVTAWWFFSGTWVNRFIHELPWATSVDDIYHVCDPPNTGNYWHILAASAFFICLPWRKKAPSCLRGHPH